MVGSGAWAAWMRSSVLIFFVTIAGCAMSWAQVDPAALAQPAEKQEPSKQPATPPQSEPSKQDSGKQEAGQQDSVPPDANKPDSTKQAVVDTVNSTVNATVDTMRRLPAQWFLGSYVPSDRNLTPLTLEERRDVYIRQTYLTGASYLKRLFSAGVDQARGAPYEWGGGLGGYGKRFGSRYGQFIIQNSIAAAGNAALGYEPRYDYCKCTGFWPRTKHAIERNFVTYNETEVERRVQIPLYVGAFGAGAISGATWRPATENPWKDGAYSVASQAGFGVLSNWLQEFALDIGRKLSPQRRRRHARTSGSDAAQP